MMSLAIERLGRGDGPLLTRTPSFEGWSLVPYGPLCSGLPPCRGLGLGGVVPHAKPPLSPAWSWGLTRHHAVLGDLLGAVPAPLSSSTVLTTSPGPSSLP